MKVLYCVKGLVLYLFIKSKIREIACAAQEWLNLTPRDSANITNLGGNAAHRKQTEEKKQRSNSRETGG